jgi:MFS family permease
MADEIVQSPAEVSAGRPPWLALPVLLVGIFLFATDAFIVNVALPTIGRTLHAQPAYQELTVASYAAAYACCLVAGGRLGDAFGRRRLFMLGMLGFVVASAACGLAPTIGALVGARIAQGAASALMVPQVLATVQALFQGGDRQRALGAFGAVIGSATAAGQVLGGAIVSADIAGLTWRPAFLINVPIGLAGLAFAYRLVPETRAERRMGMDIPGALVLAVAVMLVLLPVSLGRDAGWPPWCWLCLAAAPVAGAAFLQVQDKIERNGGSPLLPPSLLRLGGMRLGLGLALSFFLSAGGFLLTTTLSLQNGLGFGPLAAGLVLVPYSLGFLTGSLWARSLTARYGRQVVTGGAALLATGLLIFSAEAFLAYGELSAVVLAVPLMLIGLGQSFVMIPLFGVILAGMPLDHAGVASGVLMTTQQTGIALGAALMGTLFFGVAGPATSHPDWGPATVAAVAGEALLALIALVAGHYLPAEPRQPARP